MVAASPRTRDPRVEQEDNAMAQPTEHEGANGVDGGVPALNTLYFYLTEGCNLACRHCWLAPKFDPDGSRYPVLPVELFETALREAKPLGLTGVKLTGGEPLMHPHIRTLLEILRREGLGLVIETNGILCTPELAAEIAKSPDPFVSVSLDGADAATHERVRGVKGSFERALQGISNLVAAGLRPQIILSVLRENAHQVEALVRLAEGLGAGSVKFNLIQPTGRGERVRAANGGLEVAELIALGRWVDQELVGASDIDLHFDYPLAFRPLSRINRENGGSTCGILGILGVMPSGHLALCGIGHQVPGLVFGKLGSVALEEIWLRNSTLNRIRAGLPSKLTGICGACLMAARCLGSCVAQNFYRTGSLWAPFWLCAQAEADGLFPPSRVSTVPSERAGNPWLDGDGGAVSGSL